jgi:micrococcal nuclease
VFAGPLADIPGALARMAMAPFLQGCSIKGNISGKGERIYHVPGGRYYEAVKIDTDKGERFFCSEKDAEKEGFRKSRE